MDTWHVFAIVGTISFSLQGALIAMEKRYDLFAVYLFGLLTAFGGGMLQKVLIGGSDYQLWNQQALFLVAIISITIAVVFPKTMIKSDIFLTSALDAFGMVAFAIEGSIIAIDLGLPASAVVVSALVTATGGGVIRDLLSQRKPILLGENVYGFWIFLIGMIMGLMREQAIPYQYIIFLVFSALSIFSFVYNWKVPYRSY